MSSSYSMKLFLIEKLTFKEKFFHLMNLLVINYSYFVFENYVFFIIYTTQNLSNYMTNNTNGLDYNKYIIDKILFNISKIIRVKELLYEHRKYYNLFIYILSFYYVLFSIFFIMMIKKLQEKQLIL